MEQDFLESDIVFPEEDGKSTAAIAAVSAAHFQQLTFNSKSDKIRKTLSKKIIKVDSQIIEPSSRRFSVPVRNPDMLSGDEFVGEEEVMPPHLVIGGRWIAGKRMAYSVCAGKGRTLKGRDLTQFRDSVHKMTGFIEGN